MSLEQALAANTAAINALTAVLQGQGQQPAAKTADAPKDAPKATTGKAKADKAAPAKKEEPAVTYDQVKELILKVNQEKGRPAIEELLSGFGVKKGPELKPEQYAEFVAAAETLLAGDEDDGGEIA